jgi:hypothetical protein
MWQRIWLYIGTGCIAAVEIAVGVIVSPTVAVWMLIIAIPLGLFSYWKVFKPNMQISLKKRGSKMLILVGAFIIIGGIVGGGFLIKSQLDVKNKVTTIYCCVRDNTYQVWADNKVNNTDTVYITLGTSSLITDFRAIMGASLPTIIEGGNNANFITFKIEQLPPNVSLTYLIEVNSIAEQPYKFTAWSEVTKNNISVKFVGRCPQITSVGLEETKP